MHTELRPLTSMERAILALLVERLPELEGSDVQVGGDFAFDPTTMDFYIRIDRIPGGSANRLEGSFVVDIEVFSRDYLRAESLALSVEALVLGYRGGVRVGDRKVVIDTVTQNVGVADLPWEDEGTARLGATYVITARRH